ncbi:hypothetical protein B7R87_31870 [Streptomyces tsukubensis]|uniref:Uncharacterized protein n=1 Tax=Streptomyces tsukubensis (strain DSM 42081 / NBRC 108919 / NRRL 18488 / 9993) TaxID=1114943 RepID=A0A7G3U7Y9_STRT9|nr:hypothetical protein B7R87_31870 [Streptomyces tsukubensis]QKM66098.1 hypothetical protein STSU_001915 [Streptomyces tsukubensis NRRL18488]TAI42380.1 hypothetical protein EWI31_22650 [Streptomyces tsukubensis]
MPRSRKESRASPLGSAGPPAVRGITQNGNGEAVSVNINNIVADDVQQITEQVNRTLNQYGPHHPQGGSSLTPGPGTVVQRSVLITMTTMAGAAVPSGADTACRRRLLGPPRPRTRTATPYDFDHWPR